LCVNIYDAVIILVIVNLTKTCITVCSQGLFFILEQRMFCNI